MKYVARFAVSCVLLFLGLRSGELYAQLESTACIPTARELTLKRDNGQISSVERALGLRDCHRVLPGYTPIHEQYWVFFIQTASMLDSRQISKFQADEMLARKRRELELQLSGTGFPSQGAAPKSLTCRALPSGSGFTCDGGVECTKHGPVGPFTCTGFGSSSSSVGCTPLPNGAGFSCDNGVTCMQYGPVGPLTCN